MTDRYLDDLTVGESWTSEPFTMTEAEIIAFATEFDPNPCTSTRRRPRRDGSAA